MMKNIVTVSFERHSKKLLNPFNSYSFASQSQFAPLVLAELPLSIHVLPMCFVRQDTRYILAGLLSPMSGENYFVSPDGRWSGEWTPACFRSYPFHLARSNDPEKRILCVDESSGLLSESKGQPMFQLNGQLSNGLTQVSQFLQKVEANREVTQEAVDALVAADVITEWPVSIKTDSTQMQVEGLYKCDEARLVALNDETFLQLRKAPSLPIAWAQIFSMGNVRIFNHLAKIRAQQKTTEGPDPEMLINNDDMFRF